MEQARLQFMAGLDELAAGRLAGAEACFSRALALAPGRPSVMTNLGAVRLRLGRSADAVPLLAAAVAAEPDNGPAWGHLAMAHAELGNVQPALQAFDRALALEPGVVETWSRRGSLLRELGRLQEAAECFERAIALGANDDLHRYYLASVRGGQPGAAPAAPPRQYVEGLFDTYAHDFSGHLVSALHYQAHELLVQGLPAPDGRRWPRAVDLGCGTGLVGALVRGRCDHLSGVDLSQRMLQTAREAGHYDELAHADVVAWLRGREQALDLVLAADVFIYVGALEAVFAEVERLLAPQGLFAFSVEALDAQAGHDARGSADSGLAESSAQGGGETGEAGWRLMPSLRYAHSSAYIRQLASRHGLRVDTLRPGPIRQEQRQPVAGWYAYLRRA